MVRGLFPSSKGILLKGAPLKQWSTTGKTPLPFFIFDGEMVRAISLASAALYSLAAIEVVIAKPQQHFSDSSLPSFQDACTQIATSISNASAVYYPRESFITPPSFGFSS